MSSVLSYQDKKIICEATEFVKLTDETVNESIEKFGEKGSFGLWLDAKGFWNITDRSTVLDCMESYTEINDHILACFQSIEDDEENAYLRLIDLQKKIDELERDADGHAKGKSKALCALAKKFLDNHWKLDHNLKRVECVVLARDIRKTKEIADNLNRKLDQSIRNFETLQGDNRNLKNSVDELHEENQDLKNTMEKVRKENKDLKDMISQANLKADQRLREMVEETRRNMERVVLEMRMNNTASE